MANSSMLTISNIATIRAESSGTVPEPPRSTHASVKRIEEGGGKRAERMKQVIAREPEHQARRIGDRAELHHDEGHGEDDAGEGHHPQATADKYACAEGQPID